MDKFEEYLMEQITFWEIGREETLKHRPNKQSNPLEYEYWIGKHDKYSAAAQVLLGALWEYRGSHTPTMKEILDRNVD